MQRVERDEFVERLRDRAHAGEETARLLVLRVHVRWQETAQAERVALAFGESGALVDQRIVQYADAARVDGRCRRCARALEHGSLLSRYLAVITIRKALH